MYTPYIALRNHVHLVHIFIISPVLHTSMQFIWDVIIKIIAIIGFQTYSKHIPPRSYVSQYILLRNHVHPVHPCEELCIPNTSFWEAMYSKAYFHHFTCITYKYVVYIRCHHKNNYNHRFSNLFQTYPSKKLCTPRAYFDHLTCVTYKYAVYMRCRHKI